MLTSLWAAAVPSPQMHLPQWSSVVGSSVQRPLRSIRLRQAPLNACASFKNRTRNPGETVHLAFGVGFSGGDDKDPGHVVGAVAVLGPGFGEAGVLECAATVCQSQQMVEVRRRCAVGHTSAGRSARSRSARLRYALATTGHAISGANRRASAAMEPARRGCVSTWRRADAMASGIVVVDDDARSAYRGARRRAETRWPRLAGRTRWRRPEHRR